MSDPPARKLTSHTQPLTSEQVEPLRKVLEEAGFEFLKKDYTLYAARKPGVNVSVYAKGPKVLIQGKGTREFIQFLLEPLVLGEAQLGYEEEHHPEWFSPHFGIDESGKGDLFGPLVIAGTYVDPEVTRELLALGAMDSKRISSDARIRDLADSMRKVAGLKHEVVLIPPTRYNQLYQQFGNLNRLLAWGHAKVIGLLQERVPECPRALSDQFARPDLIERALQERGTEITLEQRTKAESDPAVAAASLFAREAFIDWLDRAGQPLGESLPKGVSPKVKEVGRTWMKRFGEEALSEIAKMHFKTSKELRENDF